VLAVLGERRAHLHDFPLFMVAIVIVAAVTVAVFVATATGETGGESTESTGGGIDP
jgi:hypothetical protein